jgi:hypothetical protein
MVMPAVVAMAVAVTAMGTAAAMVTMDTAGTVSAGVTMVRARIGRTTRATPAATTAFEPLNHILFRDGSRPRRGAIPNALDMASWCNGKGTVVGIVMIKCPATGHAISTGIEADRDGFRRRPVFFSRTFCTICRSTHEWFAMEAWVDEKSPKMSPRNQ